MLHENDTISSKFSIQSTRKIESAEAPGEVLELLEQLIDSGLHNSEPLPEEDLDIFLSSLEKYASDAMVQVKAFEVLLVLIANKDWAKIISKARGARFVLETMQEHPDHAKVQELGCDLMAHMALADNTLLKATGCISNLVNAMYNFPEHAIIQIAACRAILDSICSEAHADHADSIACSGVVVPVMKAMAAHISHAEVQEMGCEALGKLSTSLYDARDIVSRNGIELLIDSMAEHQDHASIQQHACHALYQIALVLQEEGCTTIVDAEGIMWIINALDLHANHEMVQQNGYEALSVLVYHKGYTNNTACGRITDDVDFYFLMDAVEEHKSNERIQFAWLRVMQCLMVSNSNLIWPIANAGGVDRTFAALSEYPDEARIQAEGLLCMKLFAECSQSLRDGIVSEGGIDYVMNTMRRHDSSDLVQFLGCALFNAFGQDPISCALIVVAGGIECVSIAMRDHENIARVVDEGDKFLRLTGNAGVSLMSAAAAAA